MKRKKITTKLPESLISLMEKLAVKKKWDIDLVHEEAIVCYINGELNLKKKPL